MTKTPKSTPNSLQSKINSLSSEPKSISSGFTIVELLVVIVVIGILATIMTAVYIGVTNNAVVASLQSDLDKAAGEIELFKQDKGYYPTNINDCPTPSSGVCLKANTGNQFTSIQTTNTYSTKTYSLNIKNNNTRYYITNESGKAVAKSGTSIGVADGLMGYYPFDTDAKDYSGNGKDGTVSGASLVSGLFNSAYQFSSGSTYISLPNSLGYTSQVSAFAWFKQLGTPGSGFHIIFGGQYLEISIPTSGQLRTGIYTNARFVSNHGSGLTNGDWHLVGFTFDGSTKKSYIDGVNVGELAITGSLTSDFTYRRIGIYGSSTTYFTNGIIDEIRIYNRALTPDEVTTLYNI